MAAKGGYDYDALVEETAPHTACLALMFFQVCIPVSFTIEEELHAEFMLFFSIYRFILNLAIKILV
jgi:hypothetical protein